MSGERAAVAVQALPLPAARSAAGGRLQRARYLADVTLHLVGRQLTTRYRRSLLGWLWAIAPAGAQLGVLSFVFTRVVPVHVADYPAFLFTGIVTWNWLATSVGIAATSIESRRDLVTRPGFPTPLLPLVAGIVGFVDYLIALPVLAVVLGLSVGIGPTILFLPVPIAIQLVLIAGLSWLVAPINVFFRDVAHLVNVVLLLGFFLTPVFYARAQAPSSLSPLYDLNPMARLIDAQRSILLERTLPPAGPLALLALAAVAVAALGYLVFARFRHALPDEL